MALDTSPAFGASPRWELYRVLSEPVRLRLLALAAEEELAIGELADLLGESQPNVSRHTAPLKAVGLVTIRREGTRAFVRLAREASSDRVVADALESGKELVRADGSLARVTDVVREREASGREFFARPVNADIAPGPGDAVQAYVATLSALLPSRALAVDVGTGDGALLDVLAPAFDTVVAIDRSQARLEVAGKRVAARGYANVELYAGEVDDPAVTSRVGEKADVVFAARILHHAPKPAEMIEKLSRFCRAPTHDGPGGALLVLDYVAHDDEAMRAEADVWLGFEPRELVDFATRAGLVGAKVAKVPAPFRGRGKDSHLTWQVLVARRGPAEKPGALTRELPETSAPEGRTHRTRRPS
ncbi:MAG: metalloregulator ArsR/SmtB family transcription factor [Myxococcales bacterium]|nr:metalloregulator ArsR/SmtB family transcription factor [Myxococcales bacterium]